MMKKLIKEDKYDGVVKEVVKDIIKIFTTREDGEYGLPEDLNPNEIEYEFPSLENTFSVFLDLSSSENVEGFDVDSDYFRDDDLIYVTVITNPKYGNEIIQPLIGKLHELIRHELEHVKQHESGYEFPKKEPKKPFKYYTQKHELDAQRRGFRRGAKSEKLDYETVVRNWFEDNQHKHMMNPEEAEEVIQQILSEK